MKLKEGYKYEYNINLDPVKNDIDSYVYGYGTVDSINDRILELHGYKDPNFTRYDIYILHRIDGPAMVKHVEKFNRYFIDGFEISKEEFKKHPQVRKAKLNRIMNET